MPKIRILRVGMECVSFSGDRYYPTLKEVNQRKGT